MSTPSSPATPFDGCSAAAHCYRDFATVWDSESAKAALPLPEAVVKAERPMPPFGCCSDLETVAVKRIQLPTLPSSSSPTVVVDRVEESLYRVCLEVCLRNYFSTYPLVAKVKDYHHKNQVSNCSATNAAGHRLFSIVSEHVNGIPLSEFQLPANDPAEAERLFRWVLCQMICLVHHFAFHGWSHLASGGQWFLDNFIIDVTTGNLKLVDFGLQEALVYDLDMEMLEEGLPPLPGVRELINLWTGNLKNFAEISKNFSPDGRAMVRSGAASIGADLRTVLMVQFTSWWDSDAKCSKLMRETLAESSSAALSETTTTLKPALFHLLAGLKEGYESRHAAYHEKLSRYLQEAAELWLFGYGSLLWKQNFEFDGRPMESYIKGYVRLFTQGSTDHRGVPGKPGRCVTLEPTPEDPEARVYGLTFRVNEGVKHEALTALDIRERSGYERHMLVTYPHDDARTTVGGVELPPFPFPSLVYIANTENDEYLGMDSIENLALNIYTSVGQSGPNKDYLLFMVEALRTLGILAGDQHLIDLEVACLALQQRDETESEKTSQAQ